MKIRYLCLAQDGVELHITRPPKNSSSNSNQYFIHLKGIKDLNQSPPSIVIIGDWEFNAFINSLALASKFIKKGASRSKRIFPSKYRDIPPVYLEVVKGDYGTEEITSLKFVFSQQEPLIKGYSRNRICMPEYQFVFYVSNRELKNIGKLIDRFECEKHKYVDILCSSREDWFCPKELIHLKPSDNIGLKTLLESAKMNITNIAPKKIKNPWLKLLDDICEHDFKIATCCSCKGLYIQDAKWKTQCLGCYYGKKPSAIKESELKNCSISPWLSFSDYSLPLTEGDNERL